MDYSPKLKRVAQQIKDILSAEDLAGVIIIQEPGYSEYVLKLDPTYSCVKIQDNKIRIKAKLADFNGNRVAFNRKVADTSNMLHLLEKTITPLFMNIIQLSEIIDKDVNAKHNDGGFTDHTTQNN
ncbi:MAG TPA: hypothetical protein DF610_16250 [Sphingobacterium sp.]|nr:hypothetical protein FM120_31350 [Sphingobacterium faecium PCAi_F2.5]HCU46186.1 hypothetical protein [Sphingobacterium sp.]